LSRNFKGCYGATLAIISTAGQYLIKRLEPLPGKKIDIGKGTIEKSMGVLDKRDHS